MAALSRCGVTLKAFWEPRDPQMVAGLLVVLCGVSSVALSDKELHCILQFNNECKVCMAFGFSKP